MDSVKVFIPPSLPGKPVIHIVATLRGVIEKDSTLFTNKQPKGFKYDGFVLVNNVEDADFVLAPHAITRLDDASLVYIERIKELARPTKHKPIFLVGTDLSHDIHIDGVIVLKGSQYAHSAMSDEYVAVPFAEDLSEAYSFVPRTKSERATVSFCGWAGFSSRLSYIKYLIRNLEVSCRAFFTGKPYLLVRKKGLFWRRKVIALLEKSFRIDTNFIIRSTFSASAKTISLDPVIARTEYVENMAESDFVLTPKGDGNFSVRFYEALSLGRIPILIDTDMVLPLENIIDYQKFILRISYKDIGNIADIVADFYNGISEEDFIQMQIAARAAYTDYLRYDRFFHHFFKNLIHSH